MKIYEITADLALRRGLDQGDIGWAVRDVRPGLMNKLTDRYGWRQWDALIKSKKWRIVDLPIRQLIASQDKVNPDFRDAVLRYVSGAEDEFPCVVKKSGHLIIMDGHHRIARAAYSGAQTVRCRYHDFDNPVPEPTSLFSESIESPEFQRWFAGSRVVDQAGRPLVVYHGGEDDFMIGPLHDTEMDDWKFGNLPEILPGIFLSAGPLAIRNRVLQSLAQNSRQNVVQAQITEATMGTLPATPENVQHAKQFLLQKWRDRALESGRQEPVDLSGACKFVSIFAQKVFGGQLRGNWDHQYLVLQRGQILDLTEPSEDLVRISQSGVDPYRHDRRFWGNRDHRSSMASCEPRAAAWAAEFLSRF